MNFLLKNWKKIILIISLFLIAFSFTWASFWDWLVKDPMLMVLAIAEFVRGVMATVFIYSSYFFDNFLFISLSTTLFNADFIKVIWSSLRDIANIIFILGSIVVAFALMFDISGWKKSLIYLIVIAFALNFSLFVSRVIVDAGNITARVMLTSISIEVDNAEEHFAAAKIFDSSLEDEGRSVAGAFIKSLAPESLLGSDFFQKWVSGSDDEKRTATRNLFILEVVLILVYFLLAKSFFKASFMFLGRLIWIVYYMAAAPVFIVASVFPRKEKLWLTQWLIPLAKRSFCIVVYIFIIWASLMVLNSSTLQSLSLTGGYSFSGTIGIFLIKFVIIYKLLDIASSIGSKWCEGGVSTLGFAGKGAGVALGGVASIFNRTPVGSMTRALIGGTAKNFSDSKALDKIQSSRFKAVRWAGDRMAMGSLKLQQMKIGGKSYIESGEEKVNRLRMLENSMAKEAMERRRRFEKGISDSEGNLRFDKIAKIADRTQQEKLEQLRELEKERMKLLREGKKEEAKILEDDKIKSLREYLNKNVSVENVLPVKYADSEDKKKARLDDTVKDKETESLIDKMISAIGSKIPEPVKKTGEAVGETAKKMARGEIIAPPSMSLDAMRQRVKEDVESVKAKIKTDEVVRAKEELNKRLKKQFEDRKGILDDKKEEVRDNLTRGRFGSAVEDLTALEKVMVENGATKETLDVLKRIRKDLKDASDNEELTRSLEKINEFFDPAFKVLKPEDRRKYAEQIRFLYDDENEFNRVKDILEKDESWSSDGKLNSDIESEIKRKVDKVKREKVMSDKELKAIVNSANRKLERAINSTKNVIDAEYEFTKARLVEEMEIDLERGAALVEQQERAVSFDETARTRSFGPS